MKNVYQCSPAEFDEQDDSIIEMHREFIRIEGEETDKEIRRQKQRAK